LWKAEHRRPVRGVAFLGRRQDVVSAVRKIIVAAVAFDAMRLSLTLIVLNSVIH